MPFQPSVEKLLLLVLPKDLIQIVISEYADFPHAKVYRKSSESPRPGYQRYKDTQVFPFPSSCSRTPESMLKQFTERNSIELASNTYFSSYVEGCVDIWFEETECFLPVWFTVLVVKGDGNAWIFQPGISLECNQDWRENFFQDFFNEQETVTVLD